jgi:hypothetical protein
MRVLGVCGSQNANLEVATSMLLGEPVAVLKRESGCPR